jgi:hypothetical protein
VRIYGGVFMYEACLGGYLGSLGYASDNNFHGQ